MSVTVDVKGALRQWRHRDQDSVLVVWRVAGAGRSRGGDAAVAAVTAAVQSANATRSAMSESSPPVSVYGWDPWMGSRGPVVYVKPADGASELDAWLGQVAGVLTAEGWEGRIEPERTETPAIVSSPRPVLTAVLCFIGWGWDARRRAVSPWKLEEGLRRRLVEWMVAWTAVTDDSLYLSQGPGYFRMTPAAVREGVLRSPDGSQVVWSPEIERMRAVTFTTRGRLVVQLRDESASWRSLLDELRQLLIAFASDCSLGLIRYAWSNNLTADDALSGWPPMLPRLPALDAPRGYYLFHRHLDAERVPDASGIQLLSDGHLERIRNLSRWTVSTVVPGRHLVEAPDLAPWYEHDQPNPEALAAAREDFADAILWTEPSQGT